MERKYPALDRMEGAGGDRGLYIPVFNASEESDKLVLQTDKRIYRSNVLGEKREYQEGGETEVRGCGIYTAGLDKE